MGAVGPYGSWLSPITSDRIVAEAVSLSEVVVTEEAIFWVEGRPSEKGRYVLVRHESGVPNVDLIPLPANEPPLNARTTVHEYGGGAWVAAGGHVYFSNFSDQRLYRVPAKGGTPEPVTPEFVATVARNGTTESIKDVVRYADATPDLARRRLIGVMEDHRRAFRADGGKDVVKVVNCLAAINLDVPGDPVVLTSGHDFYSNPRLSPDGKQLAWLTWDHPRMPWDGTELWVADVTGDGTLSGAYKVAGGPAVSLFQPEWSPDGRLYFISDENGWWNLYRHDSAGAAVAICPKAAEFGQPQWNFGMSTYAFRSAQEVVCTYRGPI